MKTNMAAASYHPRIWSRRYGQTGNLQTTVTFVDFVVCVVKWPNLDLKGHFPFRFEISEIPRGTFRLHRPDPSHRAFGYCSWKEWDTKERCWGQQFCQMERDISVKEPPSEAGPEYSGLTKPKWSVPFAVQPKFPNFGLNGKRSRSLFTEIHIYGERQFVPRD